MNITTYGIYFAIFLSLISISLIALNPLGYGHNLIILIISLELFQLSIGVLLAHFSFILDDMIGSLLTLYLLPLAGCESAIAQAILIAYYPSRGTLIIK